MPYKLSSAETAADAAASHPFHLHDPTMDTTYRFAEADEAIGKARELGATRYQHVQNDGTVLQVDVPKDDPKTADLSHVLDEMDHTSLVIALVAANPDLEDILPNDAHLKRDVEDIRRKIAERQLQLAENAREIHHVVQRHIHLHLWDEHTSDRIKALGSAVADLFRTAKDKMVEAKVQLIDNDDREVISFREGAAQFGQIFRSMVLFIKDPTQFAPQSLEEEVIESIDPDDTRPVVRLASSAAGVVLDADLEEIEDPKGGASFYHEIQVFPMIEDSEGNARLINSADAQNEEADFYDIAYFVRDSQTHEHIEDHPLYREWDNLTKERAVEIASALQTVHPDVDFEWLEEREPSLGKEANQTATLSVQQGKPEKKPFKLMGGGQGPDL